MRFSRNIRILGPVRRRISNAFLSYVYAIQPSRVLTNNKNNKYGQNDLKGVAYGKKSNLNKSEAGDKGGKSNVARSSTSRHQRSDETVGLAAFQIHLIINL